METFAAPTGTIAVVVTILLVDSMTRDERIAAHRCTYRDCERPAAKGHTTCNRHYSAGRSMAQERMAQTRTTTKEA